MRRLKPIMLVLCLAVFAVGAFVISDYHARKRGFAERTACVGNLVRIRLAKEIYADEHGLTNGTLVPEAYILREAGIARHCPSGGRYIVHHAGERPTCSHTGVIQWNGRHWRHAYPE
jgi:hypothetical protein